MMIISKSLRIGCQFLLYNITLRLEYSKRLADLSEFKETPKEGIKSSGYVVDTLEAAVWCLLHSHSYKETVLMAVNLGEDTDTIGAVAGG